MLAPYSNYVPSGLPWAPQIPEGWQVQRNGRLFSHRVETGYPDLPILEVSLRTGVRVRDMVNGKRKQVMSAKEKYKRAVKGDIAYNMMRMWQGAVGPAPADGLVSPAYVVVRPHVGVNTAYYSYLFRTAAYMQEVNKFSRGIVADRNRLYWESFKQMPSLVPGAEVQDKIVSYLRIQDAHFARFIKAKRDLIALLSEQRLRVIDDAVMNGLNRSANRKPSGIAWLEDVPDHWSVVRLRTLTSSITSGSRGWSDHAAASGPVFLRVGNLSRGTLDLKLAKTIRLDLPEGTRTESSRTQVQEGDILLSITAYIGSVGLVPKDMEEAYVSQHVARCRLRPNCANPKWVAFVLLSKVGQAHGTVCMYGGTKQGLSLNDVKNHVVLLPPPPEQDELVKHIERETAVIDSLIAAAKLELDRVREYRERLIADVVTGQVDVRTWQPGPEDQITEEDLTALGDDDDNDTTEEETDGDDGHD
ncbi:restriction endonuclease subunit S [uncultured Pseudacidovorax sp.]|uniref:restriction endonuclease subunit S n=1 Tax=uncultured Pseudacidovorax sp. TaxID=679313 RepID=UPI0025CE3B28|nr:restriction endonuclease subunit S [uncultured Pseudacidovorax sp.]